MISLRTFSAALLLFCICAVPTLAQGQCAYVAPALKRPLGYAPDTRTAPWFIVPDIKGQLYGPNYYLRPLFPPEQGVGPTPLHKGNPALGQKHQPALAYGQSHAYIPVPAHHPHYPYYFQRAQQQLAYERAQAQQYQQHPQYPYQQHPQHPYQPHRQYPYAQQPHLQQPFAPGPAGIAGLPPIHTLPHLKGKQPPPISFPTHTFVRSPRDFFMWGEAVEDEQSRLRHPALIP